jgi:TolB-like protein/class 3 adenylate cyclase
MSATRTLTVILAADAVGYSRLSEADEAAALAAVTWFRERAAEILSAHGGRIFFRAGDGIMAELPNARAGVRAALELAETVRARVAHADAPALPVRIGVHLGDVSAESDGDRLGHDVNVAARIQQLADPGEVLASRVIVDSARGRHGVRFERLGRERVKNLAEPIEVFRVSAGESRPRRSLVIGAAAFASFLVVMAAGLLVVRGTGGGGEAAVSAPVSASTVAASARASIGVLAFEDLSAEGDQEYFSDGIAEEILSVLAGVEGLHVASRTSSFAFKGQEAIGIPVIAEQLGVRHVLEGSVRKAGDTIRITVQLIDAEEDRHLWAENFNRQLSTENIFAIQDEIANAVVESLRAPLGIADGDRPIVARRPDTLNLNAYELFLEARARFIARSQANVRESIRLAEQSVALDAGFARGWAILAAAASVAPGWQLDDRDYRTLAMDAADTAIMLDPDQALAYAALGEVHAYIEPKDFGLAMSLLDEALARDPNDATARLWRGEVLLYLGFFERADRDFEACLAADPAYIFCKRNLAVSARFQGDDERALELLMEVLADGYAAFEPHLFGDLLAQSGQEAALLMLIQNAVEFYAGLDEAPWTVEPLYRAFVDPTFDLDLGLERFEARLRAQGYSEERVASFAALYHTVFRAYDRVQPTVSAIYWLPALSAPEHAAARRRMLEHFDLPAYWRANGYPPQCRPVGEDDYECS